MIHVTNSTFQSEVLDFKGVVLVDFWATWCPPCVALGPILEKLDGKLKDGLNGKTVKLVKVDVDANPELAQNYQIMGIPNMKFFVNGELKGEMVGLNSENSILAKLDELTSL